MNKSKLTRTLMAACSIVALSAVMYGCTGGGDDPAPIVDPEPDPADVDRKAINDAIGAATTAIDGLTNMSNDDDVTAAQTAINTALAALDATTVLPVTEVRALQTTINAAQTSLGTKQTAIGNYRTHQSQLSASNTDVDAAKAAVDGLSAASTDADVQAADTAVAAAEAAVAAGTMLTASEVAALNSAITLAKANLTNKKSLIADRMDQDRQDDQRTVVSGAIDAASAAVNGLTAMSSDADVAAAQRAIDATRAALDETTVLPATDVFALQDQINAASASLGTKQTAISNYRTHQSQYRAAMSEVDAAEMAVSGLSVNSTEAEVEAAGTAVQAARGAVAVGTMLTDDEMASLNGDISTAETSLNGVKMQIADRNTHQMQHTTALNAVEAAEMAIDDLTSTSSGLDVTEAGNAVTAAKAAVMDGTMLTATERATLRGKIAVAEVYLAIAETAISGQRTHDEQLAAATGAVEAAEMAVNGLAGMSSDAEVTAAQGLIDAARKALRAATVLPASGILALQSRINTAETNLGTAETTITNYRTHQSQLSAANTAVDAATMAVGDLIAMSSDADVIAAVGLITAAAAAVETGTMLTESEKAALNSDIATAEMNLGNTETVINNYRTHQNQLSAANTAVDAAAKAVDALIAMSPDDAVKAATTAITTAEAAVETGTMLTEIEKAALTGEIAVAKLKLNKASSNITAYRTHLNEYSTAMGLVKAAKTLVADLTADSEDADVTAAETAIDNAKKAVANGTTLTETEKAALNGEITNAETVLGVAESQIALRKERDTAITMFRLHGEASGATTDAATAGDNAEQAVKDAAKYSKLLGVLEVNGDSATAMANAQKVLDANQAAIQAALDATAAKTRATTAKTQATALPEGTVGKTELIAALDAAIKAADGHIKIATDIRDAKATDSLASYVEEVTGKSKKKPETAADKGKAVADGIDDAFDRLFSNKTTLVVDQDEFEKIPEPIAGRVGKPITGPSDAQGMTFEMIVGAANLMDFRIADDTGTRAVKAKSVAGMKTEGLALDGKLLKITNVADGAQITNDDNGKEIAYKGISGVLFCAGSDCKVADNELTGSWYFTDDDSDNTYLALTGVDAGTYKLEEPKDYVRYGYWLEDAGSSEIKIERYVHGPTVSKNVYGIDQTTDAFSDTSATYTGDALGMSVYKTFDTKGKELTLSSGGFTADVELTMKFGGKPTLEGTIDNFQGSAVDTSWEVELGAKSISVGTFDDGVTNDADGDGKFAKNTSEGLWSATAWGGSTKEEEEARPTGVYGGFDAKFSNGNVGGVYSTRKE